MARGISLNPRTALAIAHDIAAAAAAWCLAFLLRFNLDLDDPFLAGAWRTLPWVVPAQAAVFLAFGLYRGIWRYASIPDLKRILFAVIAATAAGALALTMARVPAIVPRSVYLLDPILLVLMMGGSRLAYRMWKERRLYGLAQLNARPVVVLGAGDAAASLIKDLLRSQEWRVVGLLDDEPRKAGRQVQGIGVLGPLRTLKEVAPALGVAHAIIAMPGASHTARRRALEVCAAAGVKALTVPSFDDLMSGRVTVSAIRNVELDDLLGRDPVVLDDPGLHRLLTGRTVLVTGAGGSIGSELCRQIARFDPARLVLFELSEFSLYRVQEEFLTAHPRLPLVCAIGDVKNRTRVEQVLREHRPQVIFHAAAYKHVPLMEQDNAWEAVQNNVLGTLVLARAAAEAGAARLVFVSTDKAVNPVNVMGASKRLAEMVCQALQGPVHLAPLVPSPPSPLPEGEGSVSPPPPSPLPEGDGGTAPRPPAPLREGDGGTARRPSPPAPPPGGEGGESAVLFSKVRGNDDHVSALLTPETARPPSPSGRGVGGEGLGEAGGTRFVMVRFGNVLGSAGSVVPKFKEQIARGGPVTVTHPEITRFFMSIPEACQLVLQAGVMGSGGEVFVLDMGQPVRIVDLARDLIRLSGFTEDEIRIVFTGLRPGEKLYEELLADDESTLPTPHPKLRIARARQVDGSWLEALDRWLSRSGPLPGDTVRRELADWVPEYRQADGDAQTGQAPLRVVVPGKPGA